MNTVQIGEIYGKCSRHPEEDRRAGSIRPAVLSASWEFSNGQPNVRWVLPRAGHEAYRSMGCPVAGMFHGMHVPKQARSSVVDGNASDSNIDG